MNFQLARAHLLELFQQHGFIQHLKNNQRHAVVLKLDQCSNGTSIAISFPGYKAQLKGNRVIYDYRVDLHKAGHTIALSHTNIITDIYNKVTCGSMSNQRLAHTLNRFAETGDLNMDTVNRYLPYQPIPPNKRLLDRVLQAHHNKHYNPLGNAFDFTLEELFGSIKWIALQEDINYPIEHGFEGRRMPFARYLETLFVIQSEHYSLENVIERALMHTRPIPFTEMDYRFRHTIH